VASIDLTSGPVRDGDVDVVTLEEIPGEVQRGS
jgi:hypothetical protein